MCDELDTYEHAFMHCPMAACVWQALLAWTEQVWQAEGHTPPTPSVALCMLGLMPSGSKCKQPPRWWLLMQRIALRWIWVTHAQRLYGDDMMYGDPDTLISHIQQEFVGRLEWDWGKSMHKQAKTHPSSPKLRPTVLLRMKWGMVARCNTQGNEVSILLPNNKPE